MRKLVIVSLVLVIVLVLSTSVAFANPGNAPGAGDVTDVANVAAGENPPLGADRESGGLLNNQTGNPAIGKVFEVIIAHHPLCDLHDDAGNHP